MPRDSRLYMTFPNDFWQHPKVELLSDRAFRVFVEMNGYSRMQDLDGSIPQANALRRWGVEPITELLESHPERPLVYQNGEEYVIRDYAQHQQTKAERDDLHQKRAEAGRRGGASKPQANASAKTKQSEAEIETEIETTTKNPSPPKAEEFEKFWSLYPRKEGKGDARKAFTTARKTTSIDTILDGLHRYKLATVLTERQFVKMPGPWLRSERWTDEQVAIVTPSATAPTECPRHAYYFLPCEKCAREEGF